MRRFSPDTLTSRITVAISLLAALAAALFIGFAFLAAFKADEAALAKQKILVRQGLSALTTAVSREQESVSVWDEAVVRTAARDRLWLAENLASWMHRFFDHDRSYVVDSRDNLIFAARAGKAVEPPTFLKDEEAAREVIAHVRARLKNRPGEDGGEAVMPRFQIDGSDVREIDGRPAVVSARPLLPHSEEVSVSEGEEYIFVAVKFLDGPAKEEVAHHSLISGLHYVPAQNVIPPPANVPITWRNGHRIGYFIWDADRPGNTLIRQVAPWGAFALVIALAVGGWQARGLRRASSELHASEARARHLAYHDTLTALPNRALFEERLDAILRRGRQGDGEAALLFLDLDRFKNVNDTLGHRAGDQLMREAASRLRETVGNAGTVARVGGDEFAIVIASDRAHETAGAVSERLLTALTAPFHLGEDIVHVGVSIGVATAPAAATCREELLRKADIALYEAKKRGRGRYQLFSDTMDDIVKQRQLVEADLRKALASGGELELVYQPLHSAEGVLTGVEALLRWNHPVHKSISSSFLITIAEERGLIVQIGDWALGEACRTAARIPVPWIAVNVSPVQLRDRNFANRCLGIIAQHNIDPRRIQVEITEAVVIDDPEIAGATLRKLRAAGVRVALDDFGTGYSSMSYLRDYPLDRLKIDRFFVHALCEGAEGRAIVAAVIDMARALKLEVTAEGVETAEQHAMLRDMGCNEMQGYLFSWPVSAAVLAERFFPVDSERRA
ncbi:putative bifunctional diguanylate cyclase/phosphodiesterase [Chelativorans alearense]|uniref:putative bifunctional diguanylate cyclase/phosphodiesterase n=1 Tax=Chelativorans alearense TaxID=2681495 RepID=UPI0013D7F429|nr:EAL domain-containing protein [Chelativorans alearense]